ncbi:hypothetical protein ACN92M_26760 (plasmid) [Paenibacillus polymyxa]|uniref:hypothetical protein n=1 Tax=Paenibacillus polymyxa TaxID=1406 RepID=UPI003B5C519F
MIWYKEKILLEDEIERDNDDDYMDFYIKEIECNATPDFNRLNEDIVIQWVIAPFLLGEYGVVYDLSPHTEQEEFILSNIAPFFDTVKGIYEGEKLTTIRLSDLKVEVPIQCEDISFHPIIQDFNFCENEISQNSIQTKNYEIIIDRFLEKNKNLDSGEEENNLWNFLKKTQTNEKGYMILSPRNWLFNQSLQMSSALRYFVKHAKEITLTVNTYNKHVRVIELK